MITVNQDKLNEYNFKQAKASRPELVKSITVTTLAGNTFDGDEDSQNRMARAIVAMEDVDNTAWVLANNTTVMVSKQELKEALRLAGQAMTNIWVVPYE